MLVTPCFIFRHALEMTARADECSWWRKRQDTTSDYQPEPSLRSSHPARANTKSQHSSSSSRSDAQCWRAPATTTGAADLPQWNQSSSIGSEADTGNRQNGARLDSWSSNCQLPGNKVMGAPAQLTANLRGANNPSKLQRLLETHQKDLNGQQLSAAFK